MSYRIYVSMGEKKMQLFGNNEFPAGFLDELSKQGCEINSEGHFNKFKVNSLIPIIKTIDEYIKNTVEFHNRRVKERNDLVLKNLKRGVKESDYEGNEFNKLLTSFAPDCYPSCNFTDNYKSGVKHNDITTSMYEVYNCGYLFISVKLLDFIGEKNYDFWYDEKYDSLVYELKEGVELYFEGY